MICLFVKKHLCVRDFRHNLKVRYHHIIPKFLKIGKYPFSLIGNMNKTPVVFDMVHERSLVPKGKKSVTIPSSGSEEACACRPYGYF